MRDLTRGVQPRVFDGIIEPMKGAGVDLGVGWHVHSSLVRAHPQSRLYRLSELMTLVDRVDDVDICHVKRKSHHHMSQHKTTIDDWC